MAEGERVIDARPAPVVGKPGTHRRVVDWLVARLEGMPGGGVLWVVTGTVALELLAHLASWWAGETAVGDPRFELLFPAPFLVFFLALIVLLDGVARSSFDEFKTTIDEPADAVARLRADLTSIPDIPALIAIVLWAGVINLVGGPGSGTDEPPVTGLVLAIVWFVTNSALALLVVHTLHQLRQVGRLQALDARVNLLDPGPINAFSRMTAATAGGILVLGVAFAAVNTTDESASGFGLEILIGATGVLFFVLPLRGMHGRLAAEKRRLLAGVNSRLQVVLERLHAIVDSGDLAGADGLQKTEAALLAERDLYLHLSTWPWSAGISRGLATAVLLPLFIGIVLRLLTHVI